MANMTTELTTATTAMDGINYQEAKEKEAEAFKVQMAARETKE